MTEAKEVDGCAYCRLDDPESALELENLRLESRPLDVLHGRVEIYRCLYCGKLFVRMSTALYFLTSRDADVCVRLAGVTDLEATQIVAAPLRLVEQTHKVLGSRRHAVLVWPAGAVPIKACVDGPLLPAVGGVNGEFRNYDPGLNPGPLWN